MHRLPAPYRLFSVLIVFSMALLGAAPVVQYACMVVPQMEGMQTTLAAEAAAGAPHCTGTLPEGSGWPAATLTALTAPAGCCCTIAASPLVEVTAPACPTHGHDVAPLFATVRAHAPDLHRAEERMYVAPRRAAPPATDRYILFSSLLI